MAMITLGQMRKPAGGSWSTIYTASLTTDDSGEDGKSFRQVVQITGAGGAGGLFRATFQASSTGSWVVDHVSIGVAVNHLDSSTTATPVELFNPTSGSGFSLTAGQSVICTSTTPIAGVLITDWLIVIMDMTASGAGGARYVGSPLLEVLYQGSGATYNSAASFGSPTGLVIGVNKVETS